MNVIWLEECREDDAPLVGGKAHALGTLLRQGFHVPPGFVITTQAYREHFQRHGLANQIEQLLEDSASYQAQLRASAAIGQLFEASQCSSHLEEEVLARYAALPGDSDTPVAVRSSATAEDLTDASFAGQQESYLWILGGQQLLRHVRRCWASLFTPQAIAYRAHLKKPALDVAMGVVVQQMVSAETAGVMLTLDPINGDRSTIIIEASYGLGVAVVNGEVTPDRMYVDKESLEIRSRSIGTKTVAYRFDPSAQGTRLQELPAALHMQPSLTDDEVLQLARLGRQMEQAMGRPQDMEWAIGPGQRAAREVFLLQARPETVWSQKQSTGSNSLNEGAGPRHV